LHNFRRSARADRVNVYVRAYVHAYLMIAPSEAVRVSVAVCQTGGAKTLAGWSKTLVKIVLQVERVERQEEA
jgi:hypothetical protein